jgi:pilus assembly protein CpaE
MADLVTAIIYSPDNEARESMRTSLEEKLAPAVTIEQVSTLARLVDRIISRKPHLAFLDLSANPEEMLQTADTIRAQAADTRLVGIYNPLQLPGSIVLSELFLEAVRHGFFDFLRIPISPQELDAILTRVKSGAAPGTHPEESPQGTVVSLFSNKGGVGKTSIGVNLAVHLAQHAPGQVAIVDAGFDLGNTREFMSLEPRYSLYDAYLQRDRLDRDMLVGLMSQHRPTGVYLLDSPRKLEQIAAIEDQGVTQIMLALKKSFKYIVVDTTPVLTPISLAIGDLSEYLLVVMESIVPTVKGTKALLSVLQEAGYNMGRVRLILNRFSRFSGNIEPHLAAQSLGRPIDYLLPYDKRLHEAANEGLPYMIRYHDTVFAGGIERIAREVGGLPPAPPKPSIFHRLFSSKG